MLITSPSFEDGAFIPKKFTCEGGDINPELLLQNIPSEAKGLALILHDPDAPMKGGFTHWVVWNIKPQTSIIKEESIPPGSVEGKNTADKIGYMGPCPPSGIHHYHFNLYALDKHLELAEGSTVQEVEREIAAHSIDKAELIGLYSKIEK